MGDLIEVLLVEDSSSDALIVRTILESPPEEFSVRWVTTLAECRGVLSAVEGDAARGVDVVLVDLKLTDASGLECVERLIGEEWSGAVVVLSGTEDREIAVSAVKMGAQDYLVKGCDGELLRRSTRYAVERSRLQRLLAEEEAERRETARHEMTWFTRLGVSPETVVASTYYGNQPLKKSRPEFFSGALKQYLELVEAALERRVYRVDNVEESSAMAKLLADNLAATRAGPRDVIDLHTEACLSFVEGHTTKQVNAYVSEARLVVLEIMGYLVQDYRNFVPVSRRRELV